MMNESNDGTSYGGLTRAWTLLMGRNLHYGYFHSPHNDLDTATQALTRLMAEHARLDVGIEVLDVGCGVGTPGCFLAEEFDCHVTGITTSEIGLREAGRLVETRNLGNRVRLLLGDGMDNGLPDASFDRVWVLQASHLMLHKDKLFAECARVLRPGGRLVLCDIMLVVPMSLRDTIEYRHEFLLLHRVFGRAKIEPLEGYRSLAVSNRFTVEALRNLSEQTRPTFDRWARNADRYRDDVVRLLGEERRRDFVDACNVLEKLWDARLLGYGLLAGVKVA